MPREYNSFDPSVYGASNFIGVDPYTMGGIQKQEAVANVFNRQRGVDIAQGQAFARQTFRNNAFGRLDTSANKGFTELMKGRMGGYTSPEFMALRDTLNRNANRQFQGSKQELLKAQGANQVSGATATAQFQKLLREKTRGEQEGYQDLTIKNIQAKKEGAADYAQALAAEQRVQLENANRQKDEILARFQTTMGMAALGSAERAGATSFVNATEDRVTAANTPTGGSAKF